MVMSKLTVRHINYEIGRCAHGAIKLIDAKSSYRKSFLLGYSLISNTGVHLQV